MNIKMAKQGKKFLAAAALVEKGKTYTITGIGKSAFVRCWKVTSIKLPETVTSIGDFAFDGCQQMVSVNIPQGVNKVGACAFNACFMLKSVTLPKGITSIDVSLFGYCESLTRVTIPEGVTIIRQLAFIGCKSLTQIDIPEGVTKIEIGAFQNCPALKSIILPSTLTTLESSLFAGTGITALVVPDSVTSIDPKAFDGSSITNLTLPEKGLTGSVDGHDWVDLGLPSGTKWATCNVGALTPDQYGDFFAFSEIKKKAIYANNKKDPKNLGDIGGDPRYDAATAQWGSKWRIPTCEQCGELFKYCSWEDVEVNGQRCKKVISKTNYKYIIIPYAGYRINALHKGGDSPSSYWSSNQVSAGRANYLSMNNGAYDGIHGECYLGFPIRPVLK